MAAEPEVADDGTEPSVHSSASWDPDFSQRLSVARVAAFLMSGGAVAEMAGTVVS